MTKQPRRLREMTAELVRTKAAGLLDELKRSVEGTDDEGLFDQTALVAPDRLVPDGTSKTLGLGVQRVEILDPGPAHSPDNVVVWFPDHGILFGGWGSISIRVSQETNGWSSTR